MKNLLKKITRIYLLTVILIAIVILALIYFFPTSATLEYLTMKLIKPYVWSNLIIVIILGVLRIICYFTKD